MIAQTTNFTYTLDNQTATLQAVNSDTGNQTTTYTYGTTLSNSGVASNLLLHYVDYPDSSAGSDRVTLTYNRLGQITTRTDQRGTVRTFNYDKLGRMTDDRVTTDGSDTDVAVKRISSTYEVRGMVKTLTSYDNATVGSGTALNQVTLTYNTFSQLIQEQQEHGGTVTLSSPNVQYGYANGGTASNYTRASTLVYPDSRQIDYAYGTSGGLDDRLNRVNAIVNNSDSLTLAGYTYLGAGTVIRIDYTEPNVRLDLWGGTTQVFDGFDRFGRIVDQRWRVIGGSDVDRYKYGYDRNSNRFYKQNTVGSTLDEFYTYDNLNRLTVTKRGTLTGGPPFTGISGTPVRELDYTLDPTGNWKEYLTKTSGTTDLDQNRTSNKVNQISTIATPTGLDWWSPSYDAAGNTTQFPQPDALTLAFDATYDAWNRLTSISGNGDLVAEYQYDGRGRRIVKKTYTGGSLTDTRHFYWSNAWQNLEERVGSSDIANFQQVWGLRYVDELVCRDYLNAGGSSSSGGGGEGPPPARLYALQDANFNVTGLLDDVGTVMERFVYDPYGTASVRDSGWSPTTDDLAWSWRHQGLMEDAETGVYYNRYRYLHADLGRFLSKDQLEYVDGPNLFQYVKGNPIRSNDPLALNLVAEGIEVPTGTIILVDEEILKGATAIAIALIVGLGISEDWARGYVRRRTITLIPPAPPIAPPVPAPPIQPPPVTREGATAVLLVLLLLGKICKDAIGKFLFCKPCTCIHFRKINGEWVMTSKTIHEAVTHLDCGAKSSINEYEMTVCFCQH